MISFHLALVRGCAIRHCDWPPLHHAKLVQRRGGKSMLYRCYPDGHVEILDIEIRGLRPEDGWSIEEAPPDGPAPAA